VTDEAIEEQLHDILMKLADLETELEADGKGTSPEWAYLDAAMLALQRASKSWR